MVSIYRKLKSWNENSKSINILITGKTGTGKSALINSIVGLDVSKEGDTLNPETKRIESATNQVGDVQLLVWDSPGLQDGVRKEDQTTAEAGYIHDIVQTCSQFDLLVYTVRMSQSRILKGGPDCKAMQILSQPNVLGPNMWHNTIIVLTFANISEVLILEDLEELDPSPITADSDDTGPSHIAVETQKQFKEEYQLAVSAIKNILIESVGLSKALADSIPIIPAGFKTSATLPKYDFDTANGERYYWLSELWLKALSVTKLNAKPAMIKLNEYRMVESQEEYEGRLKSTKEEIASQMPLIFIEKGADIGVRTLKLLGPKVGHFIGSGVGFLSWSILAKQAYKSKVLTEKEYLELKKM